MRINVLHLFLMSLLLCFWSDVIAQENNALLCSDGIDNDGDGAIDCDDIDCINLPNDGCVTCLNDGLSFADTVILYEPNCVVNGHTNPETALGVSDYLAVPNQEYVSLGNRGVLILGFVNNVVVNSGDSGPDVWIFEVGPTVEASSIELRPRDLATTNLLISNGVLDTDLDGYYNFGAVSGTTASIDIDAVIPGFLFAELKFDAIKITDVNGGCVGDTPGADIDAVCAISSVDLDCAGTVNGSAILDFMRHMFRT